MVQTWSYNLHELFSIKHYYESNKWLYIINICCGEWCFCENMILENMFHHLHVSGRHSFLREKLRGFQCVWSFRSFSWWAFCLDSGIAKHTEKKKEKGTEKKKKEGKWKGEKKREEMRKEKKKTKEEKLLPNPSKVLAY